MYSSLAISIGTMYELRIANSDKILNYSNELTILARVIYIYRVNKNIMFDLAKVGHVHRPRPI